MCACVSECECVCVCVRPYPLAWGPLYRVTHNHPPPLSNPLAATTRGPDSLATHWQDVTIAGAALQASGGGLQCYLPFAQESVRPLERLLWAAQARNAVSGSKREEDLLRTARERPAEVSGRE